MKEINSKSRLAVALSKLEGFRRPKVSVEQYITDSELAAFILWQAYMKGDIEGKVSVDLGSGTGILGIGALLLDAEKVIFVESDSDAMEIAKNNYSTIKVEHNILGNVDFILSDIEDFETKCDTVIQNPPFGAKVRHADRPFIKKALEIGNVVYSIHKSDSKEFITKYCEKFDCDITNVWDFDFPLKSSYEFHRKRIQYIKVSCFRIVKNHN